MEDWIENLECGPFAVYDIMDTEIRDTSAYLKDPFEMIWGDGGGDGELLDVFDVERRVAVQV